MLLYPVIGIFLAAVVTTFVNPYMGMINDGLTHFLNGMGGVSRIVLGMVLGGMMSIDMGGPFNKAAYVFGTAQLAEGNFEVMAALWQAVWCLRLPLPCAHPSLRRNLRQRSVSPVLSTM